jgi:D-alanyl-D-alanine carboxypeptidase
VSKYVAWVPNGDKITLRMLADMTAGLHSYTEDDAWVKTVSNLARMDLRASSSTSA